MENTKPAQKRTSGKTLPGGYRVEDLPGVDTLTAQPSQTVDVVEQSEMTIEKVWIWQETNDCLWNMAKEHYGNPFLWPKIYEANRHVIKNPHVIFPRQQLIIPALDPSESKEIAPLNAGEEPQ